MRYDNDSLFGCVDDAVVEWSAMNNLIANKNLKMMHRAESYLAS
jgi:hypothetical protein